MGKPHAIPKEVARFEVCGCWYWVLCLLDSIWVVGVYHGGLYEDRHSCGLTGLQDSFGNSTSDERQSFFDPAIRRLARSPLESLRWFNVCGRHVVWSSSGGAANGDTDAGRATWMGSLMTLFIKN